MTAAKILEIKVQASKLQETLGMLAKTQSQLNAINRALEEATEETKKSGSTLSKTFDSVCKKMKDFALTIKKGVLGGLKDSLKVARNLVMALGAAAASAIAISSGAIQRDRESKDSKVSASQLRAYQYAQEQSGMDASEFNLANLQAHIGDVRSAGLFGALGLSQHELEGLNGYDAMQKVIEAVQKKGGANMTTGTYSGLQEAISTLLGVTSRERMHLFSDKKQNEFKGHYQWGLANGIDNDTLKKGEQSWNKFKFTLESVGMELSALAMPHITKGLHKLSEVVKIFADWLKGDAGKNATAMMGNLVNQMLDLGQRALPYFIGGLSVLATVLEKLNSILSGNEGGWLGKLVGGVLSTGDWIIQRVAEGIAQIGNVIDPNISISRGQKYYANSSEGEKHRDTYDIGLEEIEHLKGDDYDRAYAILKHTHNKPLTSRENALLRNPIKVEIRNYSNSDGTITSNVSSKIGGR